MANGVGKVADDFVIVHDSGEVAVVAANLLVFAVEAFALEVAEERGGLFGPVDHPGEHVAVGAVGVGDVALGPPVVHARLDLFMRICVVSCDLRAPLLCSGDLQSALRLGQPVRGALCRRRRRAHLTLLPEVLPPLHVCCGTVCVS